uniref:Uncharacterized protein n=1 Tax=Meloidogyne hapla TaxID=6305 RepID=A0A1I8BRI8_MELHA
MNISEYTISYAELVGNLSEFGKNPYTKKLDDYFTLLNALERNLNEQLVPVIKVIKEIVEDYQKDENILRQMEMKIKNFKIEIEKDIYFVLENDEFMISEEESENIEDKISDFIHDRTVYRETAEPLSSKYEKKSSEFGIDFKEHLKEKRDFLVQAQFCYLNNDTIHELGQIDRLQRTYEEKIVQAKKLIGRCVQSSETSSNLNNNSEERNLWQRFSTQIGKLSKEVYYNLAKNIPTRKIRKNLRHCAYAEYKWRDIIILKNSVELISNEADEASRDANKVISGYSRMKSLLKMYKLEKNDAYLKLMYGDEGASSSEIISEKDEELDDMNSLFKQAKDKPLIIYLIYVYERRYSSRKTVFIKGARLEQCREIALKIYGKIYDKKIIDENKWTMTNIPLILHNLGIKQDPYTKRFINRLTNTGEFKFTDKESNYFIR